MAAATKRSIIVVVLDSGYSSKGTTLAEANHKLDKFFRQWGNSQAGVCEWSCTGCGILRGSQGLQLVGNGK